MNFQFVKPTFKASSPKKMASKSVRKKTKESKKINKSQLKNSKQIRKKMSPEEKFVPEPKEKENIFKAEKLVPKTKEKENIFKKDTAMVTESLESIDVPLEKPSGEKVTFEQNNIGADILAAYLNQIRLMLEKEKRYPFLARKNNWEGTVYIKFTILRDGGLKKVKITQSSGFEILDKEAKATIGRTSFPALPKGLKLNQLQLEVPIVFRLIR